MTRIGIAATLAVLVFAAPAVADEAADALNAFNSLYGEEVKRVSATLPGVDDAALAARLLEAARTPGNPPALVSVLCQNAYDLAMKDSGGYATAAAAMELLAEKVPAKKAECAPKILAAQLKAFSVAKSDEKAALGEKLLAQLTAASDAQVEAGDLDGAVESIRQALGIAVALGSSSKTDIQSRFGTLYSRQQKQKQIAALKARLAADPEDAAARKELLKVYLVDLDNPAEALKLLDAAADEAARKFLPEAVKPLDVVPEAVCAALGDWYRGMADQATAVNAKGVLLARAKGYYQRFIELHAADDLARTTATLALGKVEESLAALPPGAVPAPAAAKWTDCLALVDPDKHTITGKWQSSGGVLVGDGDGKAARLMLPMVPLGAYEVEIAFVRTKGDGGVFVYLPMEKTSCCFALAWGRGEASGLDQLNKKNPRDGEASVKPAKLENGREYALALRILPRGDEVEVLAALDGKSYFRWRGPTSALSLSIGELKNIKAPAVNLTSGALELRRARLRMISGEMKPAADLPPPPTPVTKVAVKPEPKVPDPPAVPEAINGNRFFGVAARAGGLTPGADGWYDYLQYIDPEKNTVAGKWEVTASGTLAVASGAKNSRFILPITAPGSYELEVTFTRTNGSDAVAVCLPVGRAACTLMLAGDGGAASGLDLVNNKPYKDNETSVRPASLFNDSKYTVVARVLLHADEAEIIITLNGKPYIKWRGPPSALGRAEAWKLPDGRCPGLGACNATVVFHSVRMRTLGSAAAAAK